jgi:hypothetical protein
MPSNRNINREWEDLKEVIKAAEGTLGKGYDR